MRNDTQIGIEMLLSKANPVFCCYLFWASVLILKMLLMTLFTLRQRMKTKTFANPEDLRMGRTAEVRFGDANVERVRRAHRNDLENVLPFLLISLLYVAIGPHALTARLLIRIGATARLLHTIFYALFPLPQPARALVFLTTFGITCYQAFYVLICCMKYI